MGGSQRRSQQLLPRSPAKARLPPPNNREHNNVFMDVSMHGEASSAASSTRPASAQSQCEPFSRMADARFSPLRTGASLPCGAAPYVPSPLSNGQQTPQSVRSDNPA